MSRFGSLPVSIPQAVTVEVADGSVKVTGPKGILTRALPRQVQVVIADGQVKAEIKNQNKQGLSLQGTIKAHITNMLKGVTEGWSKELELVGSGYRAEVRGKDLILNIGYSHPVEFKAPEGVTFAVEKNKITVSGSDKDVVGQLAARIRETRKPDPYKAKGVKYVDEVIRRKAGKQAAKAA